jgi:hypothetical protein
MLVEIGPQRDGGVLLLSQDPGLVCQVPVKALGSSPVRQLPIRGEGQHLALDIA